MFFQFIFAYKKLIVLSAIFLYINCDLYSTVYYVDASGGNDNNNGTSSSTPWATLSRVQSSFNSSSFCTGDSILFKKGETWNGQLTVKNCNNIYLGAYGTGDKPVIGLRENLSSWNDSSNWENTGGNIWKNKTVQSLESSHKPYRLWTQENSQWTERLRVEILANLTKNGQWCQPDGYIYVYCSDSSGPSSYYSGMEALYSSYSFRIKDASYITLEELDFRRTVTSLWIENSKYITLRDCNIGREAFDGMKIIGAFAAEQDSAYITIENCVLDLCYCLPYTWEFGWTSNVLTLQGNVHHCIIRNNSFASGGHTAIQICGYAESQPVGTFDGASYNEVSENYISSSTLIYGRAFETFSSFPGLCHDNKIIFNEIVDTHTSNKLDGNNNIAAYNLVYRLRNHPEMSYDVSQAINITVLNNFKGYTGNTIANNTIAAIDSTGIGLSGNSTLGSDYDISASKVINNIVYDTGTNVIGNDYGRAHSTLHFYDKGGSPCAYENTIHHNLMFNQGYTDIVSYYGTYYSVSSFDAANLINNDDSYSNYQQEPLFIDYANGNLSLAWNSPCIDAGTELAPELGITTDFLGNPIYGTPDIGAFEYQPPYAMGSSDVDTAANIRIYADGKFRNTAAPASNIANFKIFPADGFSTTDRSQWMDIEIITWQKNDDYIKNWKETSPVAYSGIVNHTVGDLAAGKNYDLLVNNVRMATYAANANGEISFNYGDGYSANTEITFSVQDTASLVLGTWLFNETSGSMAADDSIYSNDGTLIGSAAFGQGAVVLSGDGDYVDFGDDSSLNMGTGNFTIIVRLKLGTQGYGWRHILDKLPSVGGSGYRLIYDAGGDKLIFFMRNGTSLSTSNSNNNLGLMNSGWNTVCVSVNRDDKILFYVNGSDVTASNTASMLTGQDISTTETLRLGTVHTPVPITTSLNGEVDWLELHRRAFSVSEMSSIGILTLDLTFDESSGTETEDHSYYENHGSLVGDASLNEGVVSLDGSGDYVSCGNDSSLHMGLDDMTIVARIKMSSAAGGVYHPIVSTGGGNDIEGYGFVYYRTLGRLSFALSSGGSRIFFNSNSSLGLDDDEWHVLAVTADRNGNATFYVDGTSVGTSDISQFANDDINGVYDCRVGGWFNNYLNGDMDYVKVFKKLLSSQEIAALNQ